MNDKEKYYISFYNTLSPNGYNLTLGGFNCKQSDETKLLKSISMIGKNKVFSKRKRINREDDNLPKYLRCYRDSSGK
jgi:hypothetical protein